MLRFILALPLLFLLLVSGCKSAPGTASHDLLPGGVKTYLDAVPDDALAVLSSNGRLPKHLGNSITSVLLQLGQMAACDHVTSFDSPEEAYASLLFEEFQRTAQSDGSPGNGVLSPDGLFAWGLSSRANTIAYLTENAVVFRIEVERPEALERVFKKLDEKMKGSLVHTQMDWIEVRSFVSEEQGLRPLSFALVGSELVVVIADGSRSPSGISAREALLTKAFGLGTSLSNGVARQRIESEASRYGFKGISGYVDLAHLKRVFSHGMDTGPVRALRSFTGIDGSFVSSLCIHSQIYDLLAQPNSLLSFGTVSESGYESVVFALQTAPNLANLLEENRTDVYGDIPKLMLENNGIAGLQANIKIGKLIIKWLQVAEEPYRNAAELCGVGDMLPNSVSMGLAVETINNFGSGIENVNILLVEGSKPPQEVSSIIDAVSGFVSIRFDDLVRFANKVNFLAGSFLNGFSIPTDANMHPFLENEPGFEQMRMYGDSKVFVIGENEAMTDLGRRTMSPAQARNPSSIFSLYLDPLTLFSWFSRIFLDSTGKTGDIIQNAWAMDASHNNHNKEKRLITASYELRKKRSTFFRLRISDDMWKFLDDNLIQTLLKQASQSRCDR